MLKKEKVHLNNVKYSVSEVQKLLTVYEQELNDETLKDIKIVLLTALEEVRSIELLSELNTLIKERDLTRESELKNLKSELRNEIASTQNQYIEEKPIPGQVDPIIEEKEEVTEPLSPEIDASEKQEFPSDIDPRQSSLDFLTDEETTPSIKPSLDEEVNEETPLQPASVNDVVGSNNTSENLNDRLDKKLSTSNLTFDVNDRIYFQKELFKDDPYQFHVSIKKIQEQNSLQDVLSCIKNDIAPQYGWNMENENAVRFVSLIERKLGE